MTPARIRSSRGTSRKPAHESVRRSGILTDVFISHNRADAEPAARLAAALRNARPGYRISLSSVVESGPAGATRWRSWIRRTLVSSDVVVLVASAHSMSPWCSAELAIAKMLKKPILPLLVDGPDQLNPLVSEFQAVPIDLPVNDIIQMIELQVPQVATTSPVDPATVEPYPGLRPLGDGERGLLFGRRDELERLLETFDDLEVGGGEIVMVSGPSGSGKSSLIRAGLIPELRARDWQVAGPFQPRQLAVERRDLAAAEGDSAEERRRLTVIDQAEELLFLEETVRQELFDQIEAIHRAGDVVILVVRNEFRTKVGDHLPKPIDHYVPYLAAEDLEAIITGPAKLAQLGIEDELTERLVRETGSGQALPLLAYTLRRLWEDRDLANVQLRADTLNKLGGVAGVLNRQAVRALGKATGRNPERNGPVLALLSRLASPTEVPATRSPVRVDLLSDEERGWLDHFAAAGLVAFRTSYNLDDVVASESPPSGQDLVDVTHEALFNWEPLATAIDAERRRNTDRKLVEEMAVRWNQDGGSDRSLLLGGDRLEFARRELLGGDDAVTTKFIKASVRADRSRRVLLVMGVIISVLAVALAYAAYSFVEERDRAREAEKLAQSVGLGAQAVESIDVERDRAMLTAAAAYRVDRNPFTEGALFQTLVTPRGPVRYLTDAGVDADWSTFRLWSADRGAVVTSDLSAAVVDMDGSGPVALRSFPVPGFEPVDVVPSSESRLLVRGPVPPTEWAVGFVDISTGDESLLRHPVQIGAAVLRGDLLAFGDVRGDVLVALVSDGGSISPPVVVDSHPDAVIRSVDLSPDGRWLAVGSTTGIRVVGPMDADRPRGRQLLEVAPGFPTSERVVFRADQPGLLLAAGQDPLIRRWSHDREGGFVEVAAMGPHDGTVLTLAVDTATPRLVSAGRGGSVQVWDLVSGSADGPPLDAHRDDVRRLSLVAGGVMGSTDGRQAIVWDLNRGRQLVAGPRPEFPPPARELVTVSSDSDGLTDSAGPSAVITADNRILTPGGVDLPAPPSARRIWSVGQRFVIEVGDRNQLDLGPVGLVVVDSAGTPTILGTGFDAVAVGSCFAAGAEGTTLRLFPLENRCSGVERVVLSPPPSDRGQNPVAAMAFSPSDDRLVLVYREAGLESRSVPDGLLLTSQDYQQRQVATGVVWVDDSRVVVGHDRGVAPNLVDLQNPDQTKALVGHDDAVWWFAVDPVRRRLFSAGQDGRVVQTDLTTGAMIGTPFTANAPTIENDPAASFRGLALSADGFRLFGVQDQAMAVWDLDPEMLIDAVCQAAGRALTDDETARLGLAEESRPCTDPGRSAGP